MYIYKNDKGATITTACEITGGGWELLGNGAEAKKETRTEETKEPKATVKRKKNE